MEVDLDLTLDDLVALSCYVNDQSPAVRRARRLARWAVPVSLALLWVLVWLQGNAVLSLVLGAVLAPVAVGYFFALPKRFTTQTARLLRNLYRERGSEQNFCRRRRLSTTPETITEATEVHVSTWKWIAIERIALDGRHAFFFVSPLSALILPKAAFATDEAFQDFVATAQRYHREALAVVDPLAPGGQRLRT